MKSTSQILEYILKYKNNIIEKLKENDIIKSQETMGNNALNIMNNALLNGQKAFIEELYAYIMGETTYGTNIHN